LDPKATSSLLIDNRNMLPIIATPSVPQQQAAATPTIPEGGWACQTCTFINTAAKSQKCDLCQTPRSRHPSTSPPTGDAAIAERDRLARASALSRQRMDERDREDARQREAERLKREDDARRAALQAQQALETAERARLAAERARLEELDAEKKRQAQARERARAAATLPWACTFCTFINPVEAQVCSVCHRTRVLPASVLPPPMDDNVTVVPAVILQQTPLITSLTPIVAAAAVASATPSLLLPAILPSQWRCPSCTLLNPLTLRECGVCRSPVPAGVPVPAAPAAIVPEAKRVMTPEVTCLPCH
jgi:hypothetical protein